MAQELIIGVVGILQLEVLEYRLKNEYGAEITIEHLPFKYIRWIETEGFNPEKARLTLDTKILWDSHDNLVLVFQNEWSIRTVEERNKDLVLSDIFSLKTW